MVASRTTTPPIIHRGSAKRLFILEMRSSKRLSRYACVSSKRLSDAAKRVGLARADA